MVKADEENGAMCLLMKELQRVQKVKKSRSLMDVEYGEILSNFTKYAISKLLCKPPRPLSSSSDDDDHQRLLCPLWVFWCRDHDDHDKEPHSASSICNLLPETLTSNWVIKEKVKSALQDLALELPEVLVQFWAPIIIGDQCLLTTSNQPFGLTKLHKGLCSYRMISLNYMFSMDGKTAEGLGLPGRVFLKRWPESTPDVRQYSIKEYQRRNDALFCNVRGSLALPVFELSGKSCVGVLELIMTSEYFSYASEVNQVCIALEEVNMESSDILDHPYMVKCCDRSKAHQRILDEISKVLRVVCETHNLPLAQTWVPCSKKSRATFGADCTGLVCLPPTDEAFYAVNNQMWCFWRACLEHHLQKGQGVVGKAFSSYSSCFCGDITQFSKTAYPLVHYARIYGLTSSFAICLQSAHTGKDYYILEFFLPPSFTGMTEQRGLLDSLVATMEEQFQNLKVASGEVQEDSFVVEVVEPAVENKLLAVQVSQTTISPSRVKVDATKERTNIPHADQADIIVTCSEKEDTRYIEKKCEKNEKLISFEVLEQHFGSKLEDAAESLSVSRSTLKRVCRQHGISRWPSHKKNKDNHSLPNLKHGNKSPPHIVGSSKDLKNLRILAVEASLQEQNPEPRWADLSFSNLPTTKPMAAQKISHVMPMQDVVMTVTVKATYRDDIIKFQLSYSSGVGELEEEVGKRLKLKVGSFNVKYLDDDGDWILIACDADLVNCMGSLRSLGKTTIRMLVQLIAH